MKFAIVLFCCLVVINAGVIKENVKRVKRSPTFNFGFQKSYAKSFGIRLGSLFGDDKEDKKDDDKGIIEKRVYYVKDDGHHNYDQPKVIHHEHYFYPNQGSSWDRLGQGNYYPGFIIHGNDDSHNSRPRCSRCAGQW